VKTLLNRRGASLLNGASHLLSADEGASAEPANNGEATSDVTASIASEPSPPVASLRSVAALPPHIGGRAVQVADIAEVEWLTKEQTLVPFRAFASFDYSASLLFHKKELDYYVTLYQDGSLWRALKAADLDSAQTAFHHFEEQIVRLSEGEMRRAQIEAQNEQLARMIAQSEVQAERLRNDLQRNATHEQIAANRQHQVRKEVAQAEAQRVAARAQLNRALRQVQQLMLANNEGVPHLRNR
jgi:hypothetical protein